MQVVLSLKGRRGFRLLWRDPVARRLSGGDRAGGDDGDVGDDVAVGDDGAGGGR